MPAVGWKVVEPSEDPILAGDRVDRVKRRVHTRLARHVEDHPSGCGKGRILTQSTSCRGRPPESGMSSNADASAFGWYRRLEPSAVSYARNPLPVLRHLLSGAARRSDPPDIRFASATSGEVDPLSVRRPRRRDLVSGIRRNLTRRATVGIDGPDVDMTVWVPGIERNGLSVRRPAGGTLPVPCLLRELLRARIRRPRPPRSRTSPERPEVNARRRPSWEK